MKDRNCAYCMEGELVDKFGIKIVELPASKVYLFKEQSHLGRVIVASKHHVSEMIDLSRSERQAFMDDVATVATALRKLFKPKKINYGAYGDTGCHLHFHLVPKYENDEFEWGGTFAMNPQRKFLTADEYAELVAKIAAELYMGGGFDMRTALLSMQKAILADGKVDFNESAMLLKALAPMENESVTISEFVKALRDMREDRQITKDESDRIVTLLNDLLS